MVLPEVAAEVGVEVAVEVVADPTVTMLGRETRDQRMPVSYYTSPSPRDGLLSRMPSSA